VQQLRGEVESLAAQLRSQASLLSDARRQLRVRDDTIDELRM
jgi:hypothetical protein